MTTNSKETTMESYRGALKDKLDAIYLIEAVRQERIPEIKDRISKHERNRYIKPGSIFVWNEKNTKIKRWTDGRKWSASRVTGIFLTYHEMIPRKLQICNQPNCSMAPINVKNDGLMKKCFKCQVGEETYHVVGYADVRMPDIETARPSMDSRFRDLSINQNYVLQSANTLNSAYTKQPRTASLPSISLAPTQHPQEQTPVRQRRNSI